MEVVGGTRDEQNDLGNGEMTPSESVGPQTPEAEGRQKDGAEKAVAAVKPALPEVDVAADLASGKPGARRMVFNVLLCFGITLGVYIALLPHFIFHGGPPTGDQPFYLMDVVSLAQDGDLDVKNNYDNSDYDKFFKMLPDPPGSPTFAGMTSPYPIGRMLAPSSARPSDEQYGAHLPGLPFVLVPGWIVGGWFQLWWPGAVAIMCLIGALVGVNVWLLAYETTGRQWIAWVVWLPIAFSNPVMSYSYLIFTELSAGLLLIYAFRRLALGWGANGPLRLALVGACIGYIPWQASRCIFLAIPLGLYAIIQWWRHRRVASGEWLVASKNPLENGTQNSKLKTQNSLLWLLIPVIISGLGMLAYNFFIFGKALPNVTTVEAGNQVTFYWPWAGGESLSNFTGAAYGLLFDETYGLLIYAPFCLLAVVGIIAMLRLGRDSDRRLLLWLALFMIPYMMIVAAFKGWHGVWCPPARYWATFVPLMAAPLAFSLYALTRNWVSRVVYAPLYAVLSLIGVGLMAIIMQDSRMMWPDDQDKIFDWLMLGKESPVRGLDVRPYLPSFRLADEVRNPANAGWMVAVSLGIILLCYFLLLLQRRNAGEGRAGRGWPYAVHGLVWLGSISVIGLGWYSTSYDYLKPRTQMIQQQRWSLNYTLIDPRGIAYLDNKIYITSYRTRIDGQDVGPGEMGVFDLLSGVFTPLNPKSKEGPIAFSHPSDVKVGPDRLLYVLNNEDNTNIFVMKPDGEVVRQIKLNNRSTIAMELYFSPDGSKIYLADMAGGRILGYRLDGGDPVIVWTGKTGILDAVTGVAVTDDETVYSIENSGRVLEISSSGDFLREYQLKRTANYAVAKGDWVDITLNKGIISINTKERYTQMTAYPVPDSMPGGPTGLIYGPGNLLYVIDAGTLIEYIVQH